MLERVRGTTEAHGERPDLLHNLFNTAPVLPQVPQVTTIHDVIHALNEWMYETWQFDYEGSGAQVIGAPGAAPTMVVPEGTSRW